MESFQKTSNQEKLFWIETQEASVSYFLSRTEILPIAKNDKDPPSRKTSDDPYTNIFQKPIFSEPEITLCKYYSGSTYRIVSNPEFKIETRDE